MKILPSDSWRSRGWLVRYWSLPRADQGRGSPRFSEGRVRRMADFFQ